MCIITLTTDFGTKDHFVPSVKGAIYSELKDAKIVDISHGISPFDIREAAYVLKNAYPYFPKGSIHIIGIDSGLHKESSPIAIALDDHYFIGTDTGIFSLIASALEPEKIVEINLPNTRLTNFPVRDVFVRVACHIARGGHLDVIGRKRDGFKIIKDIKPIINMEGQQIVGNVIHIDNYGNVVTNITRNLFESVHKGRPYTIKARTAVFKKINNHYSDVINFKIEKNKRQEDGKKIALFNSAGYLELAIYKSNPKTVGGASSLFGLYTRDIVSIYFEK